MCLNCVVIERPSFDKVLYIEDTHVQTLENTTQELQCKQGGEGDHMTGWRGICEGGSWEAVRGGNWEGIEYVMTPSTQDNQM